MEKSSSEYMESDHMMGLKDLTICHFETDHTVTSSMLSRTSSSSSSAIGDYIGTESCFDVLSDENDAVFPPEPDRSFFLPPCRRREAKSAAAAREFPPPIPRLARTENLPSHMPWVLKRVYTSDGRLILREEKVRHHEYFRAHRSNGRLTLHLVPLDDDVLDRHYRYGDDDEHGDDYVLDDIDEDDDQDQPEGDDKVDTIVHDYTHHDDDDDDHDDGNVHDIGENIDEENSGGFTGAGDDDRRGIMLPAVADQIVGGGGGSPRGKCLKSCFLGMQVPEIRPLLT